MRTKCFDTFIIARLAQIRANLVSEGWLVISDSPLGLYLRHPNGARMTILTDNSGFAYLRNGHLIKTEPFPAFSPANPVTQKTRSEI